MQKTTSTSWAAPFAGIGGRERRRLPEAERILVPVRGTAGDQQAVLLAGEIARHGKGSLYVVYIIEVPRALPLQASTEEELNQAEAILAEMEEVCGRQHVKVETELLQARQAGPAVVEEAVERGVDLIIMGMSYKRRYGDFTMGETVPYVLEHAPCPVWVLREAMRREV
ncbi:MAG: universal stress protein [Chloroflexi bacterium]|nr:universal stress protein [Chloroflexota bacterium]